MVHSKYAPSTSATVMGLRWFWTFTLLTFLLHFVFHFISNLFGDGIYRSCLCTFNSSPTLFFKILLQKLSSISLAIVFIKCRLIWWILCLDWIIFHLKFYIIHVFAFFYLSRFSASICNRTCLPALYHRCTILLTLSESLQTKVILDLLIWSS